jgi:hypothetical protein
MNEESSIERIARRGRTAGMCVRVCIIGETDGLVMGQAPVRQGINMFEIDGEIMTIYAISYGTVVPG